MKIYTIVLSFVLNIDSGFSLEAPQEYPESMFCTKLEKDITIFNIYSRFYIEV